MKRVTKRIVYCSSKDRAQGGNTGEFSINLGNHTNLGDGYSYKAYIQQMRVRFDWYQIDATNNTFDLKRNAGNFVTYQIPTGSPDITYLLAWLKGVTDPNDGTVFSTPSPMLTTAKYDKNSATLYFKETDSLTFRFPANGLSLTTSAHVAMGFLSAGATYGPFTAGTRQSGNQRINLTYSKTLDVYTSLRGERYSTAGSIYAVTGLTASAAIVDPFMSDILYYDLEGDSGFFIGTDASNLDNVAISLFDQDKRPVKPADEWTFQIVIETYEDESEDTRLLRELNAKVQQSNDLLELVAVGVAKESELAQPPDEVAPMNLELGDIDGLVPFSFPLPEDIYIPPRPRFQA